MAQDTSIEGYRMLAYAIIAQAATDYIECTKYILFNGLNPGGDVAKLRVKYCRGEIRANEAFFTSPRFDLLADRGTDGQALVELLRKRAAAQYKEALEDAEKYRTAKTENAIYIGRLSGIQKRRGRKPKNYTETT